MRYFYSEGGFQEFTLGGAEWFWLIAAAATAVGAIVAGFVLSRGVLAADRQAAGDAAHGEAPGA